MVNEFLNAKFYYVTLDLLGYGSVHLAYNNYEDRSLRVAMDSPLGDDVLFLEYDNLVEGSVQKTLHGEKATFKIYHDGEDLEYEVFSNPQDAFNFVRKNFY